MRWERGIFSQAVGEEEGFPSEVLTENGLVWQRGKYWGSSGAGFEEREVWMDKTYGQWGG